MSDGLDVMIGDDDPTVCRELSKEAGKFLSGLTL